MLIHTRMGSRVTVTSRGHLDARYIYVNTFSSLHDGERPRKIFVTKSKSRGKIISIYITINRISI